MNIPSFVVEEQHLLKPNVQLARQCLTVLVFRGGVNLAGMRVISKATPLVINLKTLDNLLRPRRFFGPRSKGHAQVGFKECLEQRTGVLKRLNFPFLPGGIWLVCGWEEERNVRRGRKGIVGLVESMSEAGFLV
jgi:hypothetical protein